MKARLHISVICPECGMTMLNIAGGIIKCVNPGCKISKLVYEAPTIELKRINTDVSNSG